MSVWEKLAIAGSVYVALVLLLGFVLAATAPEMPPEWGEED